MAITITPLQDIGPKAGKKKYQPCHFELYLIYQSEAFNTNDKKNGAQR